MINPAIHLEEENIYIFFPSFPPGDAQVQVKGGGAQGRGVVWAGFREQEEEDGRIGTIKM